MDFYAKIQNILGTDILTELNKAILKTNHELANLTKERMCKIYNSTLYLNLQ